MKTLRRFAFIIPLAAVLFPCAIDTTPRFIPGARPEQPDIRFVRGELGILTAHLSKGYELIAWRYLSGMPLSPDEQAAAIRHTVDHQDPAIEQWQQLMAPAYLIQARMSAVSPNTWYMNCLTDAFSTASATLEDRRQRYANKALTDAWIAAQVQVFSNCAGRNGTYPAEPDASLPALARADRMYQIAAAHFYAEDFDEAMRRFEAIAADAASPWQAAAKYMVARVLVRERMLAGRADGFSLAKAQLIRVAGDAGAGRFRSAAQKLIGYTDSTLDPAAVFDSAGRQLTAGPSSADFANILDEGVYLMQAERFQNIWKNADLPAPFDWIRAFESNQPGYSLRRWKETHSELWLVPSLIQAAAADADVPALLEAANKVPESSPAWATLAWQTIRLTIDGGNADAARARLDGLLSGQARALASVDNAFRGQRLQLATSFDDFLHWAPRRPIGIVEDFEAPEHIPEGAVLDFDSISILNQLVPLSKFSDAVKSTRLQAWTVNELALVGMTRAMILGDDAIALRMAPILSKAHPAWASDLSAFTNASGEARRFAASLLIARHAEFRTNLHVDFATPLWAGEEQGAWWCPPVADESKPSALAQRILSSEELKEAGQQIHRLKDAGAAQAFIAPTVMAWAKAHLNDRRVPESLYRIVRMTRYGCRDLTGVNGPISKAAFDMLHQKYSASDWAKKTPYWFKD